MSDDQIMSGSSQAPEPAPTVLPPAPKSSLNVGRLVLFIAGGVAVLAVIVGIVLWVFMSSQTGAPTTGVIVPPTTGTGTTGGTGTTTSGTLVPVATVTNAEVFTPRNPFEVIAAPTIASAATSNNKSSGSNNTTSSATALTLTDITTVSGVRKAVVSLGGTSYTVGAGEQVGTSSWKVVQINTSSVVFLYGDDRITISLGTGTSK